MLGLSSGLMYQGFVGDNILASYSSSFGHSNAQDGSVGWSVNTASAAITYTTGLSFNGKESLTGEYFFAFADQYSGSTTEYAVNFGQGSIDGSAVANFQDANGFGNFKYNPTVTTDEGSKDFLALCTKNLGSNGG